MSHKETAELKREVEVKINQSLDQLLLEIGQSVIRPHLGSVEPDDEGYREIAHKWLSKNREGICLALKESEIFMNYISERKEFKRAEIISIVLDALLANFIKSTFPIVTFTALFVKQGVTELCSDYFSNKSN